MNRYVHQIPFAAQGAFVWNRNTVHDGAPVKVGDPVKTDAFTAVRLRQMYDSRMIVPAPFGGEQPPAYLENGRGVADKIAAQIAAEEAKGKGEAKPTAQPRSAAKPAAPRGAEAKRAAAATGKAGPKRAAGKPAPKSAPKRAAR